MAEFEGLVALVTGGSSGIGAAAARLLGERGASVAVLDLAPDERRRRRSRSPATSPTGRRSTAAIGEVVERLGRLDIVINNAGIGAAGDVTANDDAEWQHVLNVNVIGMGRVARAAVPHLRNSPSAAIVNTSSAVSGRWRAQSSALLGKQGRDRRADAGHGGRPCPRGDPRKRCATRNGRHAVGRRASSRRPTIRRRPPRRSVRDSRSAASSVPTRSPTRSATWRARFPVRPPARCSSLTAACPACACPLNDARRTGHRRVGLPRRGPGLVGASQALRWVDMFEGDVLSLAEDGSVGRQHVG